MPYAFVHEGKAYGPDGPIRDTTGTALQASDAEAYNRAVEAQTLEALRSGCSHAFLYMRENKTPGYAGNGRWQVTTWLGTVVAPHAMVGDRRNAGFQGHYRGGTYRRHVSALIFGRWYQGWYMESSGDYVRLKLAKRNPLDGKRGNEPIYGPWRLDGGAQFGAKGYGTGQ